MALASLQTLAQERATQTVRVVPTPRLRRVLASRRRWPRKTMQPVRDRDRSRVAEAAVVSWPRGTSEGFYGFRWMHRMRRT